MEMRSNPNEVATDVVLLKVRLRCFTQTATREGHLADTQKSPEMVTGPNGPLRAFNKHVFAAQICSMLKTALLTVSHPTTVTSDTAGGRSCVTGI